MFAQRKSHIESERSATLIQPALEIGREDDEYEREANAVADKVMRMSDGTDGKIQRMCTGCEEEEKKKMSDGAEGKLQMMVDTPMAIRKMTDGSGGGMKASQNVEQGIQNTKGSGQSLSPDLQNEMSSKMAADFSGVKVHTDQNAVQMNKEIGAKAFTHGNDIYFNQGQYNPSSQSGKHLLAHELTHTVQQQGNESSYLQRYGDPQSFIANEGVSGTRGSLDYLPEKVDLINHLSSVAPNVEDREVFISDFLKTFYDFYLKLLATNNWDKTKSIKTKAADNAFTANQQTPQMNEGGTLKSSHWKDFGKRMSIEPTEISAVNLIDERPLEDADHLKFPELKTMVKGDKANYDVMLSTAAQTPESAADMIIQLRAISNIVSRVYSSLIASERTGMDMGRVIALYGQEGNFDMPSSADSLTKNIPTGETNGVTSINAGGNYLDFKGMVLTIPTDNAFMTSRTKQEDRKLFALAQYFNQIGGLDVVNSKLSEGVNGLANWSLANRNELKGHEALSEELEKDTLTSLKALWQQLVNNIKEETVSFKTSIVDPNPATPKDTVYRFAPIDPVLMVTNILTETAILQKIYDHFPTGMMGKEGEDKILSPGVSYMMYNSAHKTNYPYAKKLFSSSVRSAKKLSTSKINAAMAAQKKKDAVEVTYDDLLLETPDMNESIIYYLLELVTFPSGVISDTPTETQFDTYVKPWILEESRLAPQSRWDLAQYYMEHAGTDLWSSWVQTRRNSSNMRTLMEFYQNVFR